MMPNKLNPELYAKNHKKAYEEACKKFYPAIEKADCILVYCPDGHIGEHTMRDMQYAMKLKKDIVLFPNPKLVLSQK